MYLILLFKVSVAPASFTPFPLTGSSKTILPKPKSDVSSNVTSLTISKKPSSGLLNKVPEKSDFDPRREAKSSKESKNLPDTSKETTVKQQTSKKTPIETIKSKEKSKTKTVKEEKAPKVETTDSIKLKEKPKLSTTAAVKTKSSSVNQSNSKGGSKKLNLLKSSLEVNTASASSKSAIQHKPRSKRVSTLSAKVDEEENEEAARSLNDSTSKKTKPNKKRKFDDEAALSEDTNEESKKKDADEILNEEAMSDQELLEEESLDDQIMEEDENYDEDNTEDGR